MSSNSETHRIEHKRELTPELDLEKDVIAFLNTTEGGLIFIGKIKSHRQELSFEQLRIYYEEKRKPLNRQFRTNLELTTEDGALNYAAYLLADENGLSIQVAKYRGKDRVHLIEITSAGSLPEGLTQAEFFEGYSIPRNKELMRIFKDLELVEQLGSGIPRITQFFPASCFRFTENFIRSTFPAIEPVHSEDEVTDPVTPQVTPQVEQLLSAFTGEHTRQELQEKLGLANRDHFRKTYLLPALEAGYIVPTLPDKPNSSRQKYRRVR